MTVPQPPAPNPPRPPPPPPPPPRPPHPPQSQSPLESEPEPQTPQNKDGADRSLSAAADLIRTLDSAYEEMSSLSTSAANDAEDARRNARAASELGRRYTARSYPKLTSPTTPSATSPAASSSSPQWMESYNVSATKGLTTEPTSNGIGRKRKQDGPNPLPERLAQSHAQDVLALSLELERTKETLEQERIAHDQTKMSLTEQKTKNIYLEGQMEQILKDQEKQREGQGRKMDQLEEELVRARIRVEAAEEDAQLALDLAKQNDESRREVEEYLQKSLEEVEILRSQLELAGATGESVMPVRNPPHHVRFSEATTVMTVPNPDHVQLATPSKSMVSAGRRLLHSSPQIQRSTMTPAKSAERRQRLRDRLKSLGDNDKPAPLKTPRPPPPPLPPTNGADGKRLIGSVVQILRGSGRKLQLHGHWWNQKGEEKNPEVVSRTYCNSVEAKIDKQQQKIDELSSLCEYMENKLAITANGQSPAGDKVNNLY